MERRDKTTQHFAELVSIQKDIANELVVQPAQHDSSTDVAIIQIYVDSFFDPENPDGTDENSVPDWINKP